MKKGAGTVTISYDVLCVLVSCTLPVFKEFCCCCCCYLLLKFFRFEIIILINVKLDLKILAFRHISNGNLANNTYLFVDCFVDEKQNWPQAMSKCYDVKKRSHCPFVVCSFTHFI